MTGYGRSATRKGVTDRRTKLYLRLLSHFEGIVDFDAQVPYGAFKPIARGQ